MNAWAPSFLEMIAIGMASWRVAHLLARECGPWNIFNKLRWKLGIDHTEDGDVMTWRDKFLPGLVACVWCLSVYTTAGTYLIWRFFPPLVWLGAAMAIPPLLQRANEAMGEPKPWSAAKVRAFDEARTKAVPLGTVRLRHEKKEEAHR